MGKNRLSKYLAGIVLLAIVGGVVAINSKTIFKTVKAPKLQFSATNGDVASFRLQDAKLTPDVIKKIMHGANFTLLLTNDGRVFGGGSNDKGQLGIGNHAVVIGNLYEVKLPDGTKFKDIDTNDLHVVALDQKDNVWTWGMNISGQIGNGTNTNQNAPFKALTDAKEIAAGYRFSSAVKNDGSLWVWGMNCDKNNPAYTELLAAFAQNATAGGYYYGGATVSEQQDCINEQNLPIASTTPRKVPDITEDIVEVSAGYGHLLWRTQNNELWSWGCNLYAQLGREKTFNNEGTRTPSKLTLEDGVVPAKLSAGFRQSAMIDTDGQLWAWGFNETHSTGIDSDAKVIERPGKVTTAGKAAAVTAGYDGMVMLAADKKLYGVGNNQPARFVKSKKTSIEAFTKLAESVDTYAFGRGTVTYTKETSEE